MWTGPSAKRRRMFWRCEICIGHHAPELGSCCLGNFSSCTGISSIGLKRGNEDEDSAHQPDPIVPVCDRRFSYLSSACSSAVSMSTPGASTRHSNENSTSWGSHSASTRKFIISSTEHVGLHQKNRSPEKELNSTRTKTNIDGWPINAVKRCPCSVP